MPGKMSLDAIGDAHGAQRAHRETVQPLRPLCTRRRPCDNEFQCAVDEHPQQPDKSEKRPQYSTQVPAFPTRSCLSNSHAQSSARLVSLRCKGEQLWMPVLWMERS